MLLWRVTMKSIQLSSCSSFYFNSSKCSINAACRRELSLGVESFSRAGLEDFHQGTKDSNFLLRTLLGK